jgi:hypothetical protein
VTTLVFDAAELVAGRTCQFAGCGEPATVIACGRETHHGDGGHPGAGVYCGTHARVVADERDPEYIDHCPNCGAMFGVN